MYKPKSSAPASGKQRTISSFFSPKQQPNNSQSATQKPKPNPQRKEAPPKNPQVPTADDEKQDEDNDISPAVRRRASKRKLDDDKGGNSDDDLYSSPVPKKLRMSPSNDPKHPEKAASRFRYDRTRKPTDAMDVDATEDPVRKKQKEKLREKFVKKLGRVEMSRPKPDDESEILATEDAEEEEPEPGPIAKRFGKGKTAAAATAKKGAKLTPLEQQVVDIKKKYPDTVLVVEVGYKFRFFGEDARIASQNLSIMCIPGKMRFDNHPSEAHYDRFASASIPVHRLHVHVKRLVANGYKVGVVRQLETAALKAAGDNKSAPFERKLTNLYTKGTYIDDIDGLEGSDLSSGAGSGGAPNTGFLLCVTEKPGGGTGTDEKVHFGVVAVQPSTGEVIYDEFDDGFMRSEIETRLLHSMVKITTTHILF